MTNVNFQEVKSKITLEMVLDDLNIVLSKKGNSLRGQCPICESNSDRVFVVTPGKGWYCHECRRGGDVISLTQHVSGHNSAREAAISLARKFLHEPQETTLRPLEYLVHDHEKLVSRGWMSDTIAHFKGGYAPRGIHRGKLALPIHNPDLVAYVGIDLDTMEMSFPKNYDPSRSGVIGLDTINLEETVWIVSHPTLLFDLYENGIENAVAPLHPDAPVPECKYLTVSR